jgi:hypothetical protein
MRAFNLILKVVSYNPEILINKLLCWYKKYNEANTKTTKIVFTSPCFTVEKKTVLTIFDATSSALDGTIIKIL